MKKVIKQRKRECRQILATEVVIATIVSASRIYSAQYSGQRKSAKTVDMSQSLRGERWGVDAEVYTFVLPPEDSGTHHVRAAQILHHTQRNTAMRTGKLGRQSRVPAPLLDSTPSHHSLALLRTCTGSRVQTAERQATGLERKAVSTAFYRPAQHRRAELTDWSSRNHRLQFRGWVQFDLGWLSVSGRQNHYIE